ncbi:uncharacterized protein PAC_18729 [Phialocephala subalpina]|uniref:DUF6594 domain-containing protein n=1 Tax=Phialocephala subalpina TaxID=576137 RepID=A0A1L7XUX3_9HELO|nr:uncharacterized protein PAC_18729 [Phialocephala subalpina]
MAAKYSNPTVESMLGDTEDEEREEFRGTEEGSVNEKEHRHSKSSHESVIVNSRKEKRRRKHRSSGDGSRYPKSKPKNMEGRKSMPARDNGSEGPRYRHRRSSSYRSTGSTSSSEDDEPIPDHRAVLAAARARLSSPSMLSTFTTQTTATNASSSSSGSNSTVTQTSIAKRPNTGKRPTGEAPLSPAVPDPPDVFTFMNDDGHQSAADEKPHEDTEKPQQGVVEEHDGQDEDEDEEEEESSDDETPQWTQKQIEASPIESAEHPGSTSSSASSSFHGDDFSDTLVDNDTDRSTSPERSVKGHECHEPKPLETIPEIPELSAAPASPPQTPSPASPDRASSRMAAQMAAAQQRQHQYGSMNQFGTPNMPRGNAQLPVIPQSALSARYPQQMAQRPLPRAEKLPVTGYELLASQLSTRADAEDGTGIKPLYRKFEALNHRLLLHLQDELSELEEQLHRLDHADTQSRRTDRHIIPASRRAAAIAGGELQWHKTDVLGRIGFKLAQYNQALTSFNETQLLAPPTIDDIDQYREYLDMEQPIHEAETHFLDPEDDLVSLSSQPLHHKSRYRRHRDSDSPSSGEVSSSEVSSRQSVSLRKVPLAKPSEPLNQAKGNLQSIFPALAAAIATSILLPVLTFTVIPGFMGRLIVTGLVALFLIAALVQAQILGRSVLLGREAMMCAGIYAGVMTVIAGIMS